MKELKGKSVTELGMKMKRTYNYRINGNNRVLDKNCERPFKNYFHFFKKRKQN